MSGYDTTSELCIDAGHRVAQHASKCRNLHGHRYSVIARVCAPILEETGEEKGMVQDFGFTKALMIEHIHDPCDHGCIMDIMDPTVVHTLGPGYGLLSNLVAKRGWHATEGGDWPWGKLYLVPFTPTAENLARHWHDRLLEPISKRSGGRAYLKQIIVWETPNHSAAYPAL